MDETDLRLTDCNRMLSYRKRTALSMLKDSFRPQKLSSLNAGDIGLEL